MFARTTVNLVFVRWNYATPNILLVVVIIISLRVKLSVLLAVCRQIKDGVAAIFGPMSGYPAAHVQSICDTMEIPHIETRWDFQENTDFFIVNLYPHYLSMSQAYVDYVKHLQWTSFIILYEHDDGMYSVL